jgi:hypothetical protein
MARALLAMLGSRLALLSVVLLALGWTITGPLSVARHATASPFRVDYLAYDTAAAIIRRGDAERLYDPRLQHDVQQARTGNDEPSYLVYLNPPVLAAAFLPLSALPVRGAYVAAVALLAAVTLAACAIIFRLLDGVPAAGRWLTFVCIAGSTATASALISGQLTPLLLLLGAGSLAAYRVGRIGTAGMMLGALVIKPHFALAVLLALLIARQRALAAWMAAFGAVAALTSLAIVGFGGAEGYVDIMQRSFSRPASLYIDVRSEQNAGGLIALLFRVYGGPALTIAGAAVSLVALASVWRALARSPYAGRTHAAYVAALIAVFVCATAAHIQFYDLALLALPAMFIIQRAAAAPAEARPRFYGLLFVTVWWIEVAGMLAGARMSASVVPLLAFTLVVCNWPAVERWLIGNNAMSVELQPERSPAMAA